MPPQNHRLRHQPTQRPLRRILENIVLEPLLVVELRHVLGRRMSRRLAIDEPDRDQHIDKPQPQTQRLPAALFMFLLPPVVRLGHGLESDGAALGVIQHGLEHCFPVSFIFSNQEEVSLLAGCSE